MIRLLNLAAICCLIGSALYAYHIKYDTLYDTEEAAKLQRQVEAEKVAISTLKGEWQAVTAPARVQVLADKYLDLVPLNVRQTAVSAADLPRKEAEGDEIGQKLEALGLGEPTMTPTSKGAGSATPAGGRKP
jgi:cell division protein FtsL